MKKIHKTILILFIILFGLGTIFPLFHSGFFEVHDNTQVERVYQMGVSLADKSFPVRWVPDLGYGYGYPIFNFYAPLPYYVGGILFISGIGALFATKIMFGLGILLSGISMYFLTKKFFGVGPGVVGSVIYMYFPYHAVNIYVRGAVGEFFAYAAIPLIFLGLFQFVENRKATLVTSENFRTVVLTSFAIFLVAISHNLSIFMFLILLVPFIVISLFVIRNKRNFLLLSGTSIVIGFMLSAFYILPAFMEMSYTNVGSQVGGGAYVPDHFVCVGQFVDSIWGFGGSVKGCLDGLSFRLGKVNILLAIFGVVLLIHAFYRRKIERTDMLALVSFLLLCCSVFLSLSPSRFVWDSIPFMQYIQYPWRFLNFIGLFISIIASYSVFKISKNSWKKGIVLMILIIILTLFTNLKLFSPQEFNNYSDSHYTSQNHIRFDTSKISDEYLPSGFQTPYSAYELPSATVELLKTSGNVGVIAYHTGYLKASYQALSDGVIHVNYAYFPGWQASVNGEKMPIVPTADGMNISVRKGSGQLELKFVQTPIEVAGNTITILAFLVLLLGIIKTSLNSKK